MKKVPYSVVSGIVSILVTFVLYFLLVEDLFSEAICLVTLGGVLLAEIIVTLMAWLAKGDPRKVSSAFAAVIMVPVALLLSVIYINAFPKKVVGYLCVYFIFFALIMLGASFFWKFTSQRNDENEKFQNAKENMLYMRKMVKCIMLETGAEQYKKELAAIEDALHFSNDAVVCEADAMIKNMLVVLQNNINEEGFDVPAQLVSIKKGN